MVGHSTKHVDGSNVRQHKNVYQHMRHGAVAQKTTQPTYASVYHAHCRSTAYILMVLLFNGYFTASKPRCECRRFQFRALARIIRDNQVIFSSLSHTTSYYSMRNSCPFGPDELRCVLVLLDTHF